MAGFSRGMSLSPQKRRLRAPFNTAQGLEPIVRSDTNLPQGRIANTRFGTASASPLLVLTAPRTVAEVSCA